jgi:hypothetical protein
MRLIFGELKDNHNSSGLLYIGLTLVAGMMIEEWLTADIMLTIIKRRQYTYDILKIKSKDSKIKLDIHLNNDGIMSLTFHVL